MAKTKSINRKELGQRLQKVQVQVWRAVNLAQMIREGVSLSHIKDPEAAIEGLVDYLADLHIAMDPEELMHGKAVG